MKATIRGEDHEIPSLTVGQLERIAPIISGERGTATTFELFKLCVERAKPPIGEDSTPTMPEVRSIIELVLKDAGLFQADSDPKQEPTSQGAVVG